MLNPPIAVENYSSVLQAFSRSLRRESHVLIQHPNLLWQQMYNQLQWADAPSVGLVETERERRCDLDLRPWGWAKSRGRQSDELIRILIGHNGAVMCCAVSPDSAWIVTASGDRTVRVWDALTGQLHHTLKGHTEPIWGCAISPDGAWVVSPSLDKKVQGWGASTG